MLQINLTKYNFKHIKAQDFRDDGNTFHVYRNENYPKLRITKLIVSDEVYLSAQIENYHLTYEEYTKIEGYNSLGKLNGISRTEIDDECLSKWIEDIEAYHDNYMKFLGTVTMPTDEELIKKIKENNDIYSSEANKAEELIHYVLDNIQNYSYQELGSIFTYYKTLKTDNNNIVNVEDKLIELKASRLAAIHYISSTVNQSSTFKFLKETVNAK
jgi:hypothetical protein